MIRNKLLAVSAVIVIFCALKSLRAYNYCEECCQQGRFVSTECCRTCGSCDIRHDEGAVECRDNPA